MYGEQSDAVNLVAFDGFLVNVLVPLLQQGVDAWRIVVGKCACGIIEGADVSALVAQTVDSQYIIYIFYEVGQGHLCHGVESVDKLLGQQFVDAFLGGVAQHGVERKGIGAVNSRIVHGQRGAHEQVVGM